MSTNIGQFDSSQYDSSGNGGDFQIIPDGTWARMMCVDAELKDSAAGAQYAKLTYQITEGQYANRKIWMNLNLFHAKDEVRKIASEQLSNICAAIRKPVISDLMELLNIEVWGKIGVQQSKDPQYPNPQNVLRKFNDLSAGPDGQGGQPVQQQQQQFAPQQQQQQQAPQQYQQAPQGYQQAPQQQQPQQYQQAPQQQAQQQQQQPAGNGVPPWQQNR